MNGKRAKAIKAKVFDDLKYDDGTIIDIPTYKLRGSQMNRKTIYATPKFTEIYRAAKRNYTRHVAR